MGETTAAGFEQLQADHDRLTDLYTRIHRETEPSLRLRPAIDEHLRRGIRLLRSEYVQAAETRFSAEPEQEWFYREIDRLEGLAATFDRRWLPSWLPHTAQSIAGFPGVKAIVGLTGLSAAGLAVSGTCLCHLLGIVPVLIMAILIAVGMAVFDPAQKLLREKEVPAAEDAVFSQLGTEERPASRHWTLIAAAIAAGWTTAAILETVAIHRQLFDNRFYGIYWIYAGVSILVAVGVWADQRRR